MTRYHGSPWEAAQDGHSSVKARRGAWAGAKSDGEGGGGVRAMSPGPIEKASAMVILSPMGVDSGGRTSAAHGFGEELPRARSAAAASAFVYKETFGTFSCRAFPATDFRRAAPFALHARRERLHRAVADSLALAPPCRTRRDCVC